MKRTSPAIIVGFTTASVITAVIVFFMVPFQKSLASTRQRIDSTRANIVSLDQQQQNIDAVSKNFTELTDQNDLIQAVFLTNDSTVDFFNTLDELADRLLLQKFQKHLDSPSAVSGPQVVSLRISFSSSYRTTLEFLRNLQQLKTLVKLNGITVSSSQSDNGYNVQVEALVPWQTGETP